MSLIGNLGRGFGSSGALLSRPTLTVEVEDGDALATISGSTTGSTNTIYKQSPGTATWTSAGSRTGNGTVSFTLTAGRWWLHCESVLTDYIANQRSASAITSVLVPADNASVAESSDGCATNPFSRCTTPFDQVFVDHLVEGSTRVTWQLQSGFRAMTPWNLTLQFAEIASDDDAAWTDVAGPSEDAAQLVDATRRAYGKQLTPHYRVKLEARTGEVYYSRPTPVLGQLGVHDWNVARAILRKELLRLRNRAGIRGYLFKRRRDGAACSRCYDEELGQPTEPKCPVCFETGFEGGYWTPIECNWVDFPKIYNMAREHRNADSGQGLILPHEAPDARFLGTVLLSTDDVWVAEHSDLRFYVQPLSFEGHIRGVPIVQAATMRQADFDDVAYLLERP